jgi:hypothetical protein
MTFFCAQAGVARVKPAAKTASRGLTMEWITALSFLEPMRVRAENSQRDFGRSVQI